MKRLLLLALAAAFTACSPDIPTSPDESGNFVVAEFDPAHSVIPLPNDLAFLKPDGTIDGRLHAPETGGTDAQNEFNRDYLNHLDGFPLESTASMQFDKPVKEDTVVLFPAANATLAVVDVTEVPPLPMTNLDVTFTAGPHGSQTLSFLPKSGFWTRGHRYSVLVRGGEHGIKGANGSQILTGSPTWALVSSSKPLVTTATGGPCPPPFTNNCVPATGAIPTTEKDPAKQFDQQLALAKQLEQLRLTYAPIIDGALMSIPDLNRTDIVLVWTFQITSQAEVTFDPAAPIIPFPNDILNPTGSQVAIPPNSGLPPDLVAGLNTLNGFSTTAPIVTENGPGTGPLIQGTVDPASVSLGFTSPINLIATGPGSGAAPTTPNNEVKAHACLNCPGIVMTLPDGGPILYDGGPKPDTLAIVPDIPLTERTRYVAYVTTDLKDTTGKNVIASPAFALVRSSKPLFDGTHSTVSLLTDAQAEQLEQLRSALQPLFDNFTNQGLPRTNIALAWVFTTQTTVGALSQLHGAPFASPVPVQPLWVQEIPAPAGAPNPGGVVGKWYVGQIFDFFALTGTAGTINPDPNAWTAPKIAFVMSVPAAPAAGGKYPVVIFGHGFTRDRTDAFGISAAMASTGNVMVAIDEPWHGDRNTCTGFGALLKAGGAPDSVAQDLRACVNPAPGNPPTQNCNAAGHCELADREDPGLVGCDHTALDADKPCMLAVPSQGHCTANDRCEGGAFVASFLGVPTAGWKLINLQNFFATRDNLRQQVISDAQLARVASSTANGNLGQQAGNIALDGTKISYVGQSLGGILGSLYSSVAPEVKNSALNVPGGGLLNLILTSPNPSFVALKNAFQAGLAAEGVPTNSPLYDTFLGIVQWIIDPSDPLNAGPYLVKNTGLPGPLANGGENRRAYIQWIAQDQTVPNLTTVDLIQSVLADPTATGVLLTPSSPGGVPRFWAKQFPSDVDPTKNHGFLLGTAGPAVAQQAQGEIAGFVVGAPPFP